MRNRVHIKISHIGRGENGIPRRHFFVRGGSHHLHVFEQSSCDWQRHLRFRDRLLASPELATRYSELTSKLATARQASGDRERYPRIEDGIHSGDSRS